MKLQIIYDENGKVIHEHEFGWVSDTKLVSKLTHKTNEKIVEVVSDKSKFPKLNIKQSEASI